MLKKTTQCWLSCSDDDARGARRNIRFQPSRLALLGLLLLLCIPLVPLRRHPHFRIRYFSCITLLFSHHFKLLCSLYYPKL
jgi:hypothetical protein